MFPPHLLQSLTTLGDIGTGSSLLLAYLDPGTGSLLLQMLVAGLLSGTYMLRSSIWSLRKRLSRGLSKN